MSFPKDKAPYDGDTLLHYPSVGSKWRLIEPFDKTLHLIEMTRGRSSAYFVWCDEEGNRYPMFMKDMLEVVKHANVKNGRVFARWIVKKRGNNYGVGLAKDELQRTK